MNVSGSRSESGKKSDRDYYSKTSPGSGSGGSKPTTAGASSSSCSKGINKSGSKISGAGGGMKVAVVRRSRETPTDSDTTVTPAPASSSTVVANSRYEPAERLDVPQSAEHSKKIPVSSSSLVKPGILVDKKVSNNFYGDTSSSSDHTPNKQQQQQKQLSQPLAGEGEDNGVKKNIKNNRLSSTATNSSSSNKGNDNEIKENRGRWRSRSSSRERAPSPIETGSTLSSTDQQQKQQKGFILPNPSNPYEPFVAPVRSPLSVSNGVIFEGWLEKKSSGIMGRWVRRYFVLQECRTGADLCVLYQYENAKTSKWGTIPLGLKSIIFVSDIESIERCSKAKYEGRRFDIIVGGGVDADEDQASIKGIVGMGARALGLSSGDSDTGSVYSDGSQKDSKYAGRRLVLRAEDAENCLLWYAIVERTRLAVSDALNQLLEEQQFQD